jgi:hypothetical protein
MRLEATDVKYKSEVVETIEIPVFENVEEMLAELGDKAVLDLANRQNKADLSNKCRAKYRPSATGKTKLRQLAFELASKDADLTAQVTSLMGDFDGLTTFLDSLADRVKEEMDLS